MPRSPKYVAAAAPQLAPAPPQLFIGTSGWSYPTWKPGFYPAEVPTRAFLHHYAAVLTAVEVNYTFRASLEPAQLAGWLAATPPGFRFSFKAPQHITHFAKLRQAEAETERFLASLETARAAGRLGPVLFQLPPNFLADPARLHAFLEQPALRQAAAPPIAFEFRHPSWFTESTFDVLRAHNAALCVADTDELTTPDVATADFRCYRLRRDGGYQPYELAALAEQLTAHAQVGETFAFLRHQDEPTGALNARDLLGHAVRHHQVQIASAQLVSAQPQPTSAAA